MSRILYIAPVRDFSGYAAAARGYIRALHQAGADLVVRPVRYDKADPGTEYKPTDVERELLRRDLHNVDVVIQHVTPNEMRPVKDKVNIAVVAWETTRIPPYWADKLNKFDAVITFCDASVTAFRDSGVTVPIHKVPHTFQMDSYSLDGVKPVSSPSAPDFLKDRYVFYNISQFATKKGLDLLLRAYYGEFHGEGDKVLLMIKTYVNMQARDAEYKKIQGYVEAVKQGMRLPHSGYPPVMLITKTLDEEGVKRLHATGDCYVCSSRGEGWCIPAFEAMAYGKPLVTTLWGGMGEFAMHPDAQAGVNMPNVFPIKYRLEPLIGQNHGDPELYTAFDRVAELSTSSIMKQMRTAMEAEVQPRANMNEYDYSVVGPAMLEIINSVVDDASDDAPEEPPTDPAPVPAPVAPAPTEVEAQEVTND